MATSNPTESLESLEDWQTTKQTVRDGTAYMFNNVLMSDIRFVVADSAAEDESVTKRVRVPAHKLILAISSPVFEAMFYGAMAEKSEEIELPDTDSEQLLEFFRFLYYDEVNLSLRNVLSILYLAKKYIVPSLALRCRKFLKKEINERNVFEILIQAQKLHETKLQQDCWKVIDGDTESCLESEGLHCLDRDTVVELLQRDSLMVNEVTLFDAIRKWAQEKCQLQGLEPSNAHVREILGDAVYHFRFPLMSTYEFGQHVVPSGVLTEREALNVFMYFNSLASLELKFSAKPRSLSHQWKELLIRCETNGWYWLSSKSRSPTDAEYLHITVNKATYFAGVRLFTCEEEGKQFDARLVLKCKGTSGKEVCIQQAEGTFTTAKGAQSILGFDVILEKPVLLKKLEQYTVCISIHKRETEFIFAPAGFTRSREISCSAGMKITIEGSSKHTSELLLIRRP